MVAVNKQTAIPIATGSNVATVVHFKLRVSCQIVRMVVLHGLCSKLKSIKLMPVKSVQPPSPVNLTSRHRNLSAACRDRAAVRALLRVAKQLINASLKLIRDMVLQPFRFVVD